MQNLPPIIIALRDELVMALQPRRVILFGSYAKGTNTRDSDIDVLVVVDKSPTHSQQMLANSIVFDYPVKVDVLLHTEADLEEGRQQRYSFLYTVLCQAVEIYTRDSRCGYDAGKRG